MTALTCTCCGLRYSGETLPQHLLSASGPSCPRCGVPLTAEVGEEIGARRPRFGSTPERHRRAVRQTLSWAEEAAAEGDYATALSWLATLEAAEGELPPGVGARRREWASHVAARPSR